jgi:hypothetical protein
MPTSIPRDLARIVRYAWAAPCSAVGLVLGALVVLLGGRARIREGVLEFWAANLAATSAKAPRRSRIPFVAITFGHVVLARTEHALRETFAHEREHVRQYERWGVVFFLLYPASSLYQLVRGRHPYWFNHFELEARRRAGR